MRAMDPQPRYPIGEVSRRTGLSPHVLRAWERRYGVVSPSRRTGGGRLYSSADILRLRLLRRLTGAGHPIGEIASLSSDMLLSLLPGHIGETDARMIPDDPESEAPVELEGAALARALAAVEAMNGQELYGELMRSAVALSLRSFLHGLVLPLLRRAGELWEEGTICPAHEHLLSAQLNRVLGWVAAAMPVPVDAHDLVVATPAGQRHEFGALVAGIVAADEGWRVLYLGADLPARDIALAVTVRRARGVLLGMAMSDGGLVERGLEEIRALRAAVDPQVWILVGGAAVSQRAAEVEASGATPIPDLDALPGRLELLAMAGGPA